MGEMKDLLNRRITATHGHGTSSLLDELLRASRRPNDAFDIFEDVAERYPDVKRHLLHAANTAGRRGVYRVTTVRQALVRMGLVASSEVLLHAAHRAEPTVARAA